MLQNGGSMSGPLSGLTVIEMAALGPVPFCSMLFADMGAKVLRIDRPGMANKLNPTAVMSRGRPVLELNLKDKADLDRLLELLDQADVLLEGFRPGVMERLGVGPAVVLARRPSIVYARMTGWGQDGPLAAAAGHDLNYIAISGVLNAIGPRGGDPTVPLNLIGDFGGGGMLLAFGIMSAVYESRKSGRGQVIDAAMSDGAAYLSAVIHELRAEGRWTSERGDNLLDGGAHFCGVYQCSDGKYVAISPIEPQFYRLFLELCGIADEDLWNEQYNKARWPEFRARLSEMFKTRSQAEWSQLLEGTDACFAPVLDWDEARLHRQNLARGTFMEIDGVTQPAPCPRFSRTPGQASPVRADTRENILAAWSLT